MMRTVTLAATLLPLISGCGARSVLPSWRPGARCVAYVTNRSAGTVSVIDTRDQEIATTIRVGNDPVAVALSPDHRVAYVANRCGDDPAGKSFGTVSVIDTATNAATATVALNYPDDACQPSGLAIARQGHAAYVVSRCGGRFQPGLISVIDTTHNAVVASIQSPIPPRDVVVTADGRFAYVSAVASGLSVIDTSTNTISGSIAGVLTGGGMALSPGGPFIYVASGCRSSDAHCSFTGVSVIDTRSNIVSATIPLAGAPAGVAASLDGRFIYVMNTTEPGEDAVAVIDAATNTVTGSIRIGETFCRIAVVPTNQLVYATNCSTGRVAVVDTVAGTVTATVPVPGSPSDIAIAVLGS
ncbi:MAG: hypothetical protein ACHQ4J_06445 [Candidatus Binatia bacterium]